MVLCKKPTQNQLSIHRLGIHRLGIIMYNITIRNYSKENSKWNNQIEYSFIQINFSHFHIFGIDTKMYMNIS